MEVNAVVNEINRVGGFPLLSGCWDADHDTQQESKEMTRRLDSLDVSNKGMIQRLSLESGWHTDMRQRKHLSILTRPNV